VRGGSGRGGLVEVMVVGGEAAAGEAALEGLEVEEVEAETMTAKYELTVSVEEEAGGGVGLRMEYSSEVFERVTAERLLEQYSRLLHSILAQPDQNIFTLEMLSEAEKRQVMEEWQERDPTYRLDLCLHEL